MKLARYKTVLIVVDQLPWPPRNGITLPVFNYIEQLKDRCELSLLYFHEENESVSDEVFSQNERFFNSVFCCALRRKGKAQRIFGELTLRSMYQHGWEIVSRPDMAVDYDLTIVSPISAVAKFNQIQEVGFPSCRNLIAAVNDCTASEYFTRPRYCVGGVGKKIKAFLDYLRHPLIGRIEKKLLRPYSTVLLQTKTDLDFMRSLVGSDVSEKSRLCPNGVDESLFEITPNSASKNVVFVADLGGEYKDIAAWIAFDVWARVRKKNPMARLVVVGRNATPEFKRNILIDRSITHVEFVASLKDVYANAAVAFVPVFKGFGLINKTLEAMASGLPVVGGAAAFNGIEGVLDGVNAIVLGDRSAEGASEALLSTLENPEMCAEIGGKARRLIKERFSWERAANVILSEMP